MPAKFAKDVLEGTVLQVDAQQELPVPPTMLVEEAPDALRQGSIGTR